MIPYIYLPTIHLGFFSLSTWGLFAASGFAVGIWIFWKMGKKWGIDGNQILDLSFWIMLGSIIGARLGHVFLYEWNYYYAHWSEIFAIWHGGMSLFGGIIGGGLCAIWKINPALSIGKSGVKKYQLPMLKTLDALVFALPFGLGCGRIGCFLIHDHPGTLTHFILGVKYPDGVRHDLGLELLFVNIALGITFLTFGRREQRSGFFLALFLLLYPPIRFLLDFLRVADARYAGLTPAQYGMIGLFLIGFWLAIYRKTDKIKQ